MTREPPHDRSSAPEGRVTSTRPGTPVAEDPESGASSVDHLSEHVLELDTVDPTAGTADLAPLRAPLAGRTIVGLGEATHGTREFFQLKHRLVRFLVEELGCRLVALETNFAEALAIDDYVRHGKRTADAALGGLDFWIWDTEEMLAMVEWLRAFNASRPTGDRVRFYGIDAQFTSGAAKAVGDYLDTVDPAYLASVRDDLEPLIDPGLRAWPVEGQDEQLAAVDRLLPDLRATFDERRLEYTDRRSEPAWALARQHVTVLGQVEELARAVQSSPEGTSDETLRIRDRTMADNVAWILGHEPVDRLVLWAHNGHVNRVETTTNGSSAASMGRHLARRYGDGYYALALEFGTGTFQALSEVEAPENRGYERREHALDEPIPETAGSVLTRLGRDLAFLDLATAIDDPVLAEWLAHERGLHSIGAVYRPDQPETYVDTYVLSDAFDGLCYVDETSRARPLDRV